MPSPGRLQDYRCEVVFNRACGPNLKRMRLRTLAGSAGDAQFQCLPGQFVMLDLPVDAFHFRRPFSVLWVENEREFDLYYKVVGRGTAMMAAWEPGLELKVLGPLGVPFSPPDNPQRALYIGGGIGIAPVYMLGRLAGGAGHCFYGVRSAADIGLSDALTAAFGNRWHLATDDGTAGFQGNVCGLLENRVDVVAQATRAYVCGPTPMMAAVVALLHRMNPDLPVEVSLEEHMPCGTGACTGCVVGRTDRLLPAKVCVEGPVFDARLIQWPGRQSTRTEALVCPS